MSRFFGCFFLVLFGFSGCALEQKPLGAPARVGHVYLFRGVWDLLCFGVDTFTRDARAEGFEAATFSDTQGDEVERLIKNQGTGEPIIIIGYSTGVPTSIHLARRLERSHIAVDLLVTLDPPTGIEAPGNVKWCVNYYERTIPGLILFSGTRMRAKPGVKLENVRINEPNHFTLDESKQVHDEVIARMKTICPLRKAPAVSR